MLLVTTKMETLVFSEDDLAKVPNLPSKFALKFFFQIFRRYGKLVKLNFISRPDCGEKTSALVFLDDILDCKNAIMNLNEKYFDDLDNILSVNFVRADIAEDLILTSKPTRVNPQNPTNHQQEDFARCMEQGNLYGGQIEMDQGANVSVISIFFKVKIIFDRVPSLLVDMRSIYRI